jgi:hypothetical protein
MSPWDRLRLENSASKALWGLSTALCLVLVLTSCKEELLRRK